MRELADLELKNSCESLSDLELSQFHPSTINLWSLIVNFTKVQWLKQGDKNAKFFDKMTSFRHKRNQITLLTKEDDTSTNNLGEIISSFARGYSSLWASTPPTIPLIDPCAQPFLNYQSHPPLAFTEPFLSRKLRLSCSKWALGRA